MTCMPLHLGHCMWHSSDDTILDAVASCPGMGTTAEYRHEYGMKDSSHTWDHVPRTCSVGTSVDHLNHPSPYEKS